MALKKTTILASAAILSMALVNSAKANTNNVESKILKEASTLNPKVLQLAEKAFYCASKRGVVNKNFLTIIDYSQPSTKKRLWVIDMAKAKIKFNELVAHGQGSGDNVPTKFSDTTNSHESSLGVFVTKNTYIGHNGLSLRMDGLEPGVNSHALQRDVVFHGADYVSEAAAESQGRIGRSWGCPALARDQAKETINTIQGGSLVFAYYPDSSWLKKSSFLSCS
ncbi:MAG: murein L,D-transpeptidase catalytic domain family protein [Gammaproteobacteria bacterium]|jgi:hypothetical protein|nr:murein L,D-transpeptidase catalytic domain family protein [Gammaproteobacteria bacterium]